MRIPGGGVVTLRTVCLGDFRMAESRQENEPVAPQTVSPPPAPPTAPPARAAVERPSPSSWPIVLAVFGFVYAGMTALGLLASAVFMLIGFDFGVEEELAESLEPFGPWQTIVGSLVSAALMVVLVAVSVGLVRRRRWSITLGSWWAVLEIGLAVIMSVIGLYGMMRFMEQGQNVGVGMMAAWGIIGMVMGLAFWLALPVFMLIWFSRAKVREEYGRWA